MSKIGVEVNMTKPVYPSRAEAQKAGWFSRRHQTSAEHRAAQQARRERKAEKGRRSC